MGGINLNRWFLGGIIAGVAFFIMEGLASSLYFQQMQAAMEAAGLSMEMSATTMVISVLISLLLGLVIIFAYAAVRPRFGPGPKSAVVATLVLFLGGYLPSLIGYGMMGLFPASLLVLWAALGLLEMLIASMIGGWLYRES